jgi:GNAT superfamily N-acetyltransferase
MKTITIEFQYEGHPYRLDLHQYHYHFYEKRALTVWEGALFLAAVTDPTTFERINPSRELAVAALQAIKVLPAAQRRRIARRAIDRVVALLTEDYVKNLQICQSIGVL